MTSKLEEKKKKIDEQIEKQQRKKRLLLAKEKGKRAIKFKDIGRIAYRANIDQMNETALLGAFLEISKNSSEEKIKIWEEFAMKFDRSQNDQSNRVFSIFFIEDPDKEIKNLLKDRKFIWNRFRKEFYGRGRKEDIEHILKGCKYNLAEIPD